MLQIPQHSYQKNSYQMHQITYKYCTDGPCSDGVYVAIVSYLNIDVMLLYAIHKLKGAYYIE